MSHFTVLVVLPEMPTDENQFLSKALQPFHEYECTGIKDEFVVFVDEHDDVSSEWEKEKKTGEYKDINAYAEEYHGYEVKDGRIGHWTNPNRQWDWWKVGGRWSGMLVPKDAREALRGENGLMGSNFDKEGFDGMAIGNLDLVSMKSQKIASRRLSVMKPIQDKGIGWNEALAIWQAYVDAQPEDHAAFMAQRGDKDGLVAYHQWIDALVDDHPVKIFTRGDLGDCWGHWGASIPNTERDPLAWIEEAPALSCWAVLKDGVWSEKGSMGWFGMADEKRDPAEWEAEVTKLVTDLPDDHWIVMVDCHI